MIISQKILMKATLEVATCCARLEEVLSIEKQTLKSWPPRTPECVALYKGALNKIQIANDQFQISLTMLTRGLKLHVFEKPTDTSRKLKRRKAVPIQCTWALLPPGHYDLAFAMQSCLLALHAIREHIESCIAAATRQKGCPLSSKTMPGGAFHVSLWNLHMKNHKFLNTLNGIVDSCKWHLYTPPSLSVSLRTFQFSKFFTRLKLTQSKFPFVYRPFVFTGSPSKVTASSTRMVVNRLVKKAKHAPFRSSRIFKGMTMPSLGLTEMVAEGLKGLVTRTVLLNWFTVRNRDRHKEGTYESVLNDENCEIAV